MALSDTLLLPTRDRSATVPWAQTQPLLAVVSLRSQSTPRSASLNFRPGWEVLLGSRPRKPVAFSRPRVKTSTVWPSMSASLVKPIVAAPLRLKPWPSAMEPLKLKLLLLMK